MFLSKMNGERVSVNVFSGEVKRLMLERQKFSVLDEKGRLIGLYTPIKSSRSVRSKEQPDEPLDELGKIMRQIAEANGMTLEELEDLLVGDLP